MAISQELEVRIINAYDLGNTNTTNLARVFKCKVSEVNTIIRKRMQKDHPFAKYFYQVALTMGEDSRLGTRAVNVALNALHKFTRSSKQKWLTALDISWRNNSIDLDELYVDEAFCHLRAIDPKIIKQSKNCGKKVYEVIKNTIQLYKTTNDSDVYLRSKYYKIMKKFDSLTMWKNSVYKSNNLSEVSLMNILRTLSEGCDEISNEISGVTSDYKDRRGLNKSDCL